MRKGASGGKLGLGQSGGGVTRECIKVRDKKEGGSEAALPYWLRTLQDSVVVVSKVEEIE